jgi:multidrug efflux pump subunit AcrB
VLARDEERVSIETLRSLQVQVPGGRTVPLSQFVRIGYAQDTPLLWREDRNPTLTVRADTAPGVLPQTVVDDLEATVGEVSAGLPPGYRIEVGGTVEASAESQASVVAVFPLMILVMLTVLMFQLKSFQRLIIVLAIAPLGLIGVVLALLLSGKPLGFVALLGILALIGIITKNAVILVDQIESERAAGRGVREAAVSAATARFRPIMLTALSTVLGMIPIAPTVFWGSMAFSVMGGLFVATALTLVLLPTLYVTWFERRGEGAEPTTVRAPAPAEEATP